MYHLNYFPKLSLKILAVAFQVGSAPWLKIRPERTT
jgi:hypothetical protein